MKALAAALMVHDSASHFGWSLLFKGLAFVIINLS
jgi:hypothetical protein